MTDAIGLAPKAAPGARELRKFGWVMAGAFGLIGGVLWWRGGAAAPYLGGLSAFFLIMSLVAPMALGPIERVWMALAEKMGMVMTTVILTITYFVLMTPLGLVRRMLGHETLGLRPDPSKATYWIAVDPQGPAGRPDKPF